MTDLSQAPRVGFGWDRHRLAQGRPCTLGGLLFADEPLGPVGHSDGDVLLHALCDALLGGAGLDDLGTLFPDTDPAWRDAASTTFLENTMERLAAAGLRPASVDLVLVCDRPKIGPRRAELRQSLAERLGLPADRVNVKGKTTEGGPADHIDAHAVVLLIPAPLA